MLKKYYSLLLLVALILTTGCSKNPSNLSENYSKAPLFEKLGSHTYKISTKSELAQRYFNQGLNLTHGFNHAEAGRSFKEAARIDKNCAMCYWGAAYVLGPNINAPMEESSVIEAYELTQKAVEVSKKGTEKEKGLINALSKRYSSKQVEDRSFLDLEYASAMRMLTKKYPNDEEILSLFAESLLDLHPWNYWRSDGNPHPWTPEILETLEKALQINENHPLANHLYIHAVEASPNPEKGIPSAERLGDLVPDAGHLVHMPSHIYIRVGRYNDASIANKKAIESDESYVSQCHAQGVYPLAYKPHNIHFLWASSTLEGRSDMAIKSAWDLAGEVDKEMMTKPGLETLQHFYITPLYAMVKFGKWEDILKQPLPSENLVYPRGVWDYAMGMAYLRTKQMKSAKGHLQSLINISSDPNLEKIKIWDSNKTSDLLKIATHMLKAEIAESEGNYKKALKNLYKAKDIEDSLNYGEPHDWFSPVTLTLGDVLLKAGVPKEAEKVYIENLRRYPENGWALYGLYKSLRAQKKYTEAKAVKSRFDRVWANSDVELTASRF
jgi:tetratricopeptide (TPR) repeat protein